MLPRKQLLTHSLTPLLERFAGHKTRRSLAKDPLYQAALPEVERVLQGFAWDFDGPQGAGAPRSPDGVLRAVAWNIERGKRFEAILATLQNDPILQKADLLLLNEADLGMGRSQNRDVVREIASVLKMRYVFANSHLVLSPGDSAERDHNTPNTLSLHGNALLSRYPIGRFEAFGLPEYHDKFLAIEKRLGEKRALLVEVLLPEGPLWVAVVHLDPFCSMKHRGLQLRMILRRLAQLSPARLLLGGDFNTTTYNLKSGLTLTLNLAYKLMFLGWNGTIEQYLTPEKVFERPIFSALRDFGIEVDSFNDRAKGTIYFDMNDPEVKQKTLEYIPMAAWTYTERRIAPWGGSVPLRFDWFAGKGVTPTGAYVVERPKWQGMRAADHNPIAVDLVRR